MYVAFPLPSVGSPKADRIKLYSRHDGVEPKVVLNSGFVATPYSTRALRSAAATAN